MMIDKDDLKDGMEVWYCNLSFRGGRTLREYADYSKFPVKGKLVIENTESSTLGKVFRLKNLNNEDLEIAVVYYQNYGNRLGSVFYATREDAVEDWNRILQEEIDRIKSLVNKYSVNLTQKYKLV